MFDRLLADPLVREHFTALSDSIENAMGGQLREAASDNASCFRNTHAQPLICLYQMSVWSALRTAGIVPSLVAGYSLGELSAWGVAGALRPADVIALARLRAQAMDACTPPEGGMLAVQGWRGNAIEALARQHGASIAIRNGDGHVVLAGPLESLARVEATLQGSSARVVRLRVSVPAHSPWQAAAVPLLRHALELTALKAPEMPVLAGIDGQPRYRPTDAIDCLSRQLMETIEWAQAMTVAVEMGTSCFFEIGPGNALSRLLRAQYPQVEVRAIDDFAALDGAIAWMRQRVPA